MTTTLAKIFTPSPQQAEFLDWIEQGTGSAIVVAVAGAGKTTTLVEGVRRMLGTVFLGAFNNKNAKELASRIRKMGEEYHAERLLQLDEQGKKDLLWSYVKDREAKTFHAAGWRAVTRAQPELRKVKFDDVVSDKKVRGIAEHYVLNTLLRQPEDGELPAVCQLVSLAKQTGFYVKTLVPEVKPSYYAALVERHDVADRLPDGYPVHELYAIADAVLRLSNERRDLYDFDDMIYVPLLRNLRFWQYDWVLIDEAQDTNAARREMAKRMLKRGGRLIAVGDPHQAIYGFTGADNESMRLIQKEFGCVELRLSVSWRCPTAVVQVARTYVSHIDPAETAPAGQVLRQTYRQMLETVQPGEAVLCRFNAPLVDLCFRLIREGKPAKIEGRAIGEGLIGLVGRWKVTTLDGFETRLRKWHERERGKITAAPKGPDEMKLARQDDKFDTMVCLLERAREQKMRTVAEMQDMIRCMFEDEVGSGTVVLSSVHKSKGLEWPVVRILGRGDIMPSPRAKQDWQKEQEVNLCYVAVTRAQATLIDVPMPTEDDLRPSKKPEPKKEAA